MTISRFVAIGDVHGNSALLLRAILAARSTQPEVIFCVGDVAGSPAESAKCCELLSIHGVITVRGNHDRWLLEAAKARPEVASSVGGKTLRFLATLPVTSQFTTMGGVGMVCHGVAENDLGYFPVSFLEPFMNRLLRLHRLPHDCRVIVHGHSHQHKVRSCNGVTIISASPLRDDATDGCVEINLREKTVSSVPF